LVDNVAAAIVAQFVDKYPHRFRRSPLSVSRRAVVAAVLVFVNSPIGREKKTTPIRAHCQTGLQTEQQAEGRRVAEQAPMVAKGKTRACGGDDLQ
jgi:hypothetical protein